MVKTISKVYEHITIMNSNKYYSIYDDPPAFRCLEHAFIQSNEVPLAILVLHNVHILVKPLYLLC